MKRLTNVACATVAALTGLTALTAACHRSSDGTETTGGTPSTASPISSVAPVDHLGPGELMEGGEQAFGITLPRGLHVDEPFVKVVYATGTVPVHPLVLYLRDRLKGGDLREGESSATFDHVTTPAAPDRPLSIHISVVHQKTNVVFSDVTPPPQDNLPNDDARWRAVGLTPSGRLLDPTHLN